MNSSTCIQCEMTKGGVSSGLATRQADRKLPLPLPSQHHNLLPSNSPPLRSHFALLPLLLLPTRNAVNSPSCSSTSSNRPPFLPNSTLKTFAKSSRHTKGSAPRSSHALMD